MTKIIAFPREFIHHKDRELDTAAAFNVKYQTSDQVRSITDGKKARLKLYIEEGRLSEISSLILWENLTDEEIKQSLYDAIQQIPRVLWKQAYSQLISLCNIILVYDHNQELSDVLYWVLEENIKTYPFIVHGAHLYFYIDTLWKLPEGVISRNKQDRLMFLAVSWTKKEMKEKFASNKRTLSEVLEVFDCFFSLLKNTESLHTSFSFWFHLESIFKEHYFKHIQTLFGYAVSTGNFKDIEKVIDMLFQTKQIPDRFVAQFLSEVYMYADSQIFQRNKELKKFMRHIVSKFWVPYETIHQFLRDDIIKSGKFDEIQRVFDPLYWERSA